MKIQEYMRENEKWEEILMKKPFSLRVEREGEYVLLKYNQVESDFTQEIVRECRGIIFNEEENYKAVCVPFYKFGNYGEGYAHEIDWNTARVQEKVDGSLIKVWFDKEWHVSTNGKINAYDCEICATDLIKAKIPYKTFGELFDVAKENANLDFDSLNKEYTYMFELVSPYNKIVVSYPKIEIYHIGTRNNITLEELDIDIGVKKPKMYSLKTLEDCLDTTSKMSYNEEGYVVVDAKWDRVKIKSPAYVAAHHLKNNGEVNIASIVSMIRKNEKDEFLGYFPEYKEDFEDIEGKIDLIISKIECDFDRIKVMQFDTKKDFALQVKDLKYRGFNYSGFFFSWWNDKTIEPKKWFWDNQSDNKIKEMIKCVNQH